MTAAQHQRSSLSIRKLRNAILVGLTLGVAVYTAVMFSAARDLSNRLGPQVRVDLEWRVLRGAQELARAADLGLAVSDPQFVTKAFGAYAKSPDVLAIVAVDKDGTVIAQHGQPPESTSALLQGSPGTLREGHGFLVSWGVAEIEGVEVGRVAVVVSTQRLQEARALLRRSSVSTVVGGFGVLLLGAVVISFFARAVMRRDEQLSDYSANLERKVEERTRELDERNLGMRLLLDNVAQGFLTVGIDGVMAQERSAVVTRWFGEPPASGKFSEYLGRDAPDYGAWFEVGVEQLRDGFMPVALVLDQLPARFVSGDRIYDVAYTPLGHGDTVDRLLVVISDATEHVAHQRSEREQRELAAFFQHVMTDRAGVEEFVSEGVKLVDALRREADVAVQKRLVHTLKGNCAMFGLDSYVELTHAVEQELVESGGGLNDEQRARLVTGWKRAMNKVGTLLGSARRSVIEVERHELEALAEKVRFGASGADVGAALHDLTREPIRARLSRLARQAEGLAARLGKPRPQCEIRDRGLRLDAGGWNTFFGALVHVVRNAVNHGLEPEAARVALGKPARGRIELSAERSGGELILSVRDDGRGIDFERVRAKARRMGLRHATHDDLVQALFVDGLSTRDQVSQVSGRGVGMSALQDAVQALGGSVEVESMPGRGTLFRFRFEERRAASVAARAGIEEPSSLMPVRSSEPA